MKQASESPHTRALGLLSGVARDPLLRFAALGALLFLVHAALAREAPSEDVIVVDAQKRGELLALFRQRQQREPSARERELLIARWIEDEALFREALRRDLVHSDAGLRDALIARMRTVLQDAAPPAAPTPAELSAYHSAHRERYQQPALYSFTEYLVPSGPHAEDQARALLSQLGRGQTVAQLAVLHSQRPESEISALYGAALAQKLAALPLSTWSLLRSPRGLHVVALEARSEALAVSGEALRARLSADWNMDQRSERFGAQLRALTGQWSVRRDGQ